MGNFPIVLPIDKGRKTRVCLKGSAAGKPARQAAGQNAYAGLPLITRAHQELQQFPLRVLYHDQHDFRLHTHDFMELVYVRRGSGMHLHGKEKYPIIHGDCFIVLPGAPHGYSEVEGLGLANVLFYPRLLDPRMAELRTLPGFKRFFFKGPLWRTEAGFKDKLHLRPAQKDHAEALLAGIKEELDGKRPGHQTCAVGLFYQLLVSLSRDAEEARGEPPPASRGENSERRVAKAVAYLEAQYDRDLRLAEVADAVSSSPSHLAHQFKQGTGLSLFEYLLRIRIDKARALLSGTRLPITEVALRVGFNDPSYFSRAFKKRTGQTPAQLRMGVIQSWKIAK